MWLSVLEKRHGGADLGHFGRINISYDQGLFISSVSEDLAERIYDGRAPDEVEVATLSYTIYPYHETLTFHSSSSKKRVPVRLTYSRPRSYNDN